MFLQFGIVVLLDPIWDIDQLSTLTKTFWKVFKGIIAFPPGSRCTHEIYVMVVRTVIHVLACRNLDDYLDQFLHSSLFLLGQIGN